MGGIVAPPSVIWRRPDLKSGTKIRWQGVLTVHCVLSKVMRLAPPMAACDPYCSDWLICCNPFYMCNRSIYYSTVILLLLLVQNLTNVLHHPLSISSFIITYLLLRNNHSQNRCRNIRNLLHRSRF